MLQYRAEIVKAMTMLAEEPSTYFLGQAVAVPGTAMFGTLENVPMEKRLELPVAEEMQMGMSIGLAFNGFIPISIYPRWNFLLLAINQLVNHLDKVQTMTRAELAPRVIIRTSIGSERPLHPQHQHVGDFSDAIRSMCSTIEVVRLEEPHEIVPAYQKALTRNDGRSTILVEYGDYYNEK